MNQRKPILHGRDHLPGGADPIGTGAVIDLGRYVIAAVPSMRNLWAGYHEPTSSGDDAMTTIACPLVETAGPAPLSNVFYDVGWTPAWSGSGVTATLIGCSFRVFEPEVECTGVQFWGGVGTTSAVVKLWDDQTNAQLAVGSGGAGGGWNEIYFDEPAILAWGELNYTVSWNAGERPTGVTNADPIPRTAGTLAATTAPAPWRRQLTPADARPDLGTNVDYAIGPIVEYQPTPGQLYVVATAMHGTDPGVWIHRTEFGDGVLNIFWSASDAIVSAGVLAMGIDPGTTQPCASENYRLLGNCLPEPP